MFFICTHFLFLSGDPPSAPINVSVVIDSQQNFIIRWSGAVVSGRVIVNGYNIRISGPDDECGDRRVPQFTATEPYQYQCTAPSVAETYIFSVFGVCGSLEGPAVVANVTLQGTL